MKPVAALSILAISLAIGAGTAVAGEAGIHGANNAVETVVVVGKREQPITRAAASVSVIDAEMLARTLSVSIRDAVRYEPGVTVPSDPIRFGVDTFAIRGIGGSRVASEVDGVPVPDGFAIGNFASSGRSFVPIGFVDRIELLRGPASALHGSDAIAGVVAFDTLDPADVADDGSGAVQTSVDYSSADRSRGATGVLATRTTGIEALLGVEYRMGGDREIAGPAEPNPRDYVSSSAIGKLVWPGARAGRIEVAATGDRARTLTDVEALLALQGRFANTVAMRGDDSSERLRFSIERQSWAPRGPDGLTWQLYWQRSAVQQDTHEERAAAPPRIPGPTAIHRRFDFSTRHWGGEVTVTRQWRKAGWQHDLVYGIAGDTATIGEMRSATLTDTQTGATTDVILGEKFPLRDFPRTRVRELGLFVQDELRSPADRWTLIPAVRIDGYDLEPLPDTAYAAEHPGSPAVGAQTLSVSPKFGIIHRVEPGLSLYAQYSRGFRPPPFSDVNIGLEIPLFNVRAIPNPDLEPETSNGFEVGIRAAHQGWSFEASAYYTAFENFIESRVNLGRDPDSGIVLFQSRNVAEARIYGVEASLSSSIVRRPPGWSWRGSLSWARGEDQTTGYELQAVAPAQLVLSSAYGSISGRWSSELILTAVDRKRGLADRDQDLFAPHGYLTLDLFAYVELGDHLSVDIGLLNATDAHYTQWPDVAGRSANDPLLPFYRQPGRSISLRVSWRP